MEEMVNLTSEQLSENKDQPEIQMDYTGTEKVFCQFSMWESRVLNLSCIISESSALCWKDFLWGLQSYSRNM